MLRNYDSDLYFISLNPRNWSNVNLDYKAMIIHYLFSLPAYLLPIKFIIIVTSPNLKINSNSKLPYFIIMKGYFNLAQRVALIN